MAQNKSFLDKAKNWLNSDDEDDEIEYDDYVEENTSSDRSRSNNVRPLNKKSGISQISTVQIEKYSDVVTVGKAYRSGVPVVLNLVNASEIEGQRAVDFASGLTFGLHGELKNIAPKVFLLTPNNVEISDEETDDEQTEGVLY